MILNGILLLVHLFLAWLITYILPAGDVSASAAVVSAVSTAGGYLAALRDFIPSTTILLATGALFVFEFLYAVYKMIRWAYQKIPGVN